MVRARKKKKRRRGEREWEREKKSTTNNKKNEIDTHLLVKWIEQIKLGRFRQRAIHPPRQKNGKPTEFQLSSNANLKIYIKLHHT